jgi:hypothetical protein
MLIWVKLFYNQLSVNRSIIFTYSIAGNHKNISGLSHQLQAAAVHHYKNDFFKLILTKGVSNLMSTHVRGKKSKKH